MRRLIDDTPKSSSSKDIQRAAQCIGELIVNQLFQFPTQLDREAIMQKVLTLPLVLSTPKHLNFSRQATVDQELLLGLVKSLFKVQGSNSATKLVVKHVILTTIKNSDKTSLLISKRLVY
jgi:hypothetical protein